MNRARPGSPLALAVLLAALAAPPLLAAPAERTVRRELRAELRSVEVENLAGAIEVVPATAGAGRLVATVRAEDSAGRAAREWTEAVELDFAETGGRLTMRAVYPLERHRRIHYPNLRHEVEIRPEWLATLIDVGSSTVEYQNRRVRVVGRASAAAPTLWVDVRLELPAGVDLVVRNSVGTIRTTGVAADQVLDSASGDIEAAGGRGALDADTGSGDVTVARHDGDVVADTGSGDVTLTDVRAESIAADTGSGDVRLERCSGALRAQTGSGNLIGRELVLGRRLRAETGSGDVRLSGEFAAVRDLVVDTGSGDVTLVLASVPSVQLRVSTGSGDIDVDVDAMRVRRSQGDFVADLAAADCDATIDTGSGDVRVRQGREGG